MNTTTTVWICTDPDTYQHCRRLSDTEFEFVQMEEMITGECYAFTGCVDIMDYMKDPEGQEKLSEVLAMYGYSGWLDLEAQYGDATFQIAAECIFETYMCLYPDHRSDTAEECRAWLDDYMNNNMI